MKIVNRNQIKHYVFLIVVLLFLGNLLSAQKRPDVSEFVPRYASVVENLEYVKYGDRSMFLDLYRPKDFKEKLPTIVVIRGGGFRVGDKNGFASMSAALAKEGFATVCIEYRVTTEALFPAAILDAKSAVKWIRDNAEKYNLDINRIGVLGASAGAHLSMTLGVTANVPELNPGPNQEDYKVKAAVVLEADADFATATDDKNLIEWLGTTYEDDKTKWELASPINHIDKDDASILFIHGADDPIVPIEQSTNSIKRLIENDVHCELISLPHVGHSFWVKRKWFEFSVKRATVFFNEQL